MNMLKLANAEGYAAYNENRSAAPALSAVIQAMIADMKVGTGAADVFQAFTDGFNQAADEECARILAS